MKRFENIVQSETAPNTNSLWIKDNILKYFNNGQWVPLSYQENGSNNNGVIDNLKEILDFLEGFDDDGTLKDFIEFQITDIRNRINAYGDPKYIESVRLATQYSSEPIDITKDFAVIMNDGSLYIEKNINWEKYSFTEGDKRIINLNRINEIDSKFVKILSLGDLTNIYGIYVRSLGDIEFPYCYPWGIARIVYINESNIPEGYDLSKYYLYNDITRVKIPAHFTFTSEEQNFTFNGCDFTAHNPYYDYYDRTAVIDIPNAKRVTFENSHFNNFIAVKFKQANTLTTDSYGMFAQCVFDSFPSFVFPKGEKGTHIMDPENPTGTHITIDFWKDWELRNLPDLNSTFVNAGYGGPNSDNIIMDFSVFKPMSAKRAWHSFYNLNNMPHIQLYLPANIHLGYDLFSETDYIKTLIITDLGPGCAAILRGLPLLIEHIELNLTNASSFGTPNKIYTANIVLLYHLKCDCNISNFPLIGDDSVERTLTYLQTVTNKTFTLNTNVYNRIIKQDKFKELIAAAEAKGWTITHATTEAADKVYNAKYDNITSRLSNVEEGITNLTTQVDSIEPYTLPVATTTTLGGIKSGLSSIDSGYSKYKVLHIDATNGHASIVIKNMHKVTNNTAQSSDSPFSSRFNLGVASNGTPSGLCIESTLRTFDGDRDISSFAKNFVLEKGLYSVINPINNSITTLTANLSNLTDAVEGLSTTVDGIQPDTLPTNSDFITALVTQLKNNSEFKAAVKQIMAEGTATTNEGQ